MEPKSDLSSEIRKPASIQTSFVLPGSLTQCISSGILVFLLALGLCFLYVRFSHSFLGEYAIRAPLTNEILPPPELSELFRRGDWELEKTTRIVQFRNLMILVSQVVNPDSDRMVCSPCTILFFPENETDLVRRIRAVIKMRVRGSVEITMNRSGSTSGFGELAELHIPGRLEIIRAGDPSRPEESFFLSAENVSVNQERLWTPGDFSVRYGRHSGEGTGLRLNFLPTEEDRGISFSNIELAEIQKLKYATFAPGAFRSTDSPDVPVSSDSEPSRTFPNGRDSLKLLEGNAPISVTCRGQMNFRFSDRQLSLLNDVQILQGSPESPTGQMNCENLTLELSSPTDSATTPALSEWNSPGAVAQNSDPESLLTRKFSQMKIRRFEAIGYPAKLYSAPDDLYVEAKTIQYDAASESLKMTNLGSLGALNQGDSQEDWLVLRQGTSQLETRQLQCTLRPGEGLVRCSAQAGRLTLWSQTPNGPTLPSSERRDPADAQLYVHWNGRMELEPESTSPETGESRRLSLTGGVTVTGMDQPELQKNGVSQTSNVSALSTSAQRTDRGEFEPFQILAGSVSMWLGSSRIDSDSRSLEPRRLHAIGSDDLPEVQMVTNQLTGHFEDVQLWFEPAPLAQSSATDSMTTMTPRYRIARSILAQVVDSGTVLSPPIPIASVSDSENASSSPGATSETTHSTELAPSTSDLENSDFVKDSHFDLRATRLQAQVLLASKKSSSPTAVSNGVQVQELRLSGRVYLEEQPNVPTDEEPLRMNCEQLSINDASDLSCAMFHLEGTPVKIMGRGVQFESNTLTVDRGTRQAYAQGAGTVTLHPTLSPTSSESPDQSATNSATNIPTDTANNTVVQNATDSVMESDLMSGMAFTDPVTISWKERMQLQGTVLTFESVTSPVEVDSGANHLRTESLSVVFHESPLSETGIAAGRENLDRICCNGSFHYQGQNFDKEQSQRGEMELIAAGFEVDREGNFTAGTASDGQGFFRIVQSGNFGNMSAMTPGASAPASTDPDAKTAVCGTFRERMSGNLREKHLTLSGRVMAMMDRVNAWSDRLVFGGAPLGDRINLNCEQLSLTLIPIPAKMDQDIVQTQNQNPSQNQEPNSERSRRPFFVEFAMTGGAEVSHRSFTATAAEIKYSEAKSILTLQGTDLVNAKIYFSDTSRGREPCSSRTIQYNPVTQRISLDGLSTIRSTN